MVRPLRWRAPLSRRAPHPVRVPAHARLEDLVAMWPLNEAEGSARLDAHNSYDLSESATSGGVGSAAAKIDDGAVLDPANNEQLLRPSAESVFTPVGGFTCGGWLYVNAFASNDTVIGSRGVNTAASSWGLELASGGGLLAFISDGSTEKVATYGGSALSTGTWYYVTIWYDPSGSDVVGINVDRGTDYTTSTASFTPQAPQVALALSGRGDTAARLADVRMDGWAFWSVAKTDAVLDSIENGGSGLAYEYWATGAPSSNSPLARRSGAWRYSRPVEIGRIGVEVY